MKNLTLIFVVIAAISCGKADQKNLEEKTLTELQVANDNQDKRARILEDDLAKKQQFFSSVEGTYEGSFLAGDKEFKTRLTIIPSLPPYTSTRTRTAEEIVADLNNLFFSIQTTHWNTKSSAVAAGCIFNQVRPDFQNGQINASAESCNNVYKISLYDSEVGTTNFGGDILKTSKEVSNRVFLGSVRQVNELVVLIQPTLVSKTFEAKLKRIKP